MTAFPLFVLVGTGVSTKPFFTGFGPTVYPIIWQRKRLKTMFTVLNWFHKLERGK